MERILENEPELPEPDAWASTEAVRSGSGASTFNNLIEKYLADGGKIQTVEIGVTALADTQSLWSFPVGKGSEKACAKLREEGQVRRKAQSKSQNRGTQAVRKTRFNDAAMVAMLGPLLDSGKTKKEIHTVLECSDSLVQRLLQQYFHDDKRADPYRTTGREEAELRKVEAIRRCIAQGAVGTHAICAETGIDMNALLRLERKFGLKITRQKSGRQVGKSV